MMYWIAFTTVQQICLEWYFVYMYSRIMLLVLVSLFFSPISLLLSLSLAPVCTHTTTITTQPVQVVPPDS